MEIVFAPFALIENARIVPVKNIEIMPFQPLQEPFRG